MLHSEALRRARSAGARVCLAGRPRGVLHVCESPKRPGGSVRRPVCGTRCRRLYVQGEEFSPHLLGRHVSGRSLCRRCSARVRRRWAAAPAARAEQPLNVEDAICAILAAADADDYWRTVRAVFAARPRVPWASVPPVASRVPRITVLDAAWTARRQLGIGDDCRRTPLGRTTPGKRPLRPAPPVRPIVNPPNLAVLAFERDLGHNPVLTDDAIRAVFGMSSMRYHQVLNACLDDPASFEFDAVLINRLRRLREQGRAARAGAIPAAMGGPS